MLRTSAVLNNSSIEEATKCLLWVSLKSEHSTRMCLTVSGHWQVVHSGWFSCGSHIDVVSVFGLREKQCGRRKCCRQQHNCRRFRRRRDVARWCPVLITSRLLLMLLVKILPPLCVWPHLFRAAGHEKRRAEQSKWTEAFRLYNVHSKFSMCTATRTSSYSAVGTSVFMYLA